MYQDHCTSFTYLLALHCEDDLGFSQLIERMRDVRLGISKRCHGEQSDKYALAVTAYDETLQKLEAQHRLRPDS
jgi:hypothetical protein